MLTTHLDFSLISRLFSGRTRTATTTFDMVSVVFLWCLWPATEAVAHAPKLKLRAHTPNPHEAFEEADQRTDQRRHVGLMSNSLAFA
eukprot:m.221884 g.221884  ORF g.221884 m.221884 type:complete len:87 (-) comp18726_c5_seq1:442-702(-)